MSRIKSPTHSEKQEPRNNQAVRADFHQSVGGEPHQPRSGANATLTTNQGLVLSDNQISLKANSRGPVLLEDFILREKITHFDHERTVFGLDGNDQGYGRLPVHSLTK